MLTRVNGHLVRNGDMTDGCGDLLAAAPKCDFAYSDPPWGTGNLKYWRTMHRKMDPAHAPDPASVAVTKTDNAVFLQAFFGIVRRACHDDAVVWVEHGLRWRDEVIRKAGEVGLSLMEEARPVYGSQSLPLVLMAFAFRPREFLGRINFAKRVDGTKGFPTLRAATAGFGLTPGKVILDPCCGMGYTARLACESGMTFVGNELNAVRLNKTIGVLTKGQRGVL